MTPRLLAGLVAMPFVAAIAGFVLTLIRVTARTGQFSLPVAPAFAVAVFFFLAAGIVVCLVAGPLFFWWTKRRTATLNSCAAWGMLFGNIPTILAVGLFTAGRLMRGESLEGIRQFSYVFAAGTTTGLVCGAMFWLLALRKPSTN